MSPAGPRTAAADAGPDSDIASASTTASAADRRRARDLVRWFRKHQRDLPWRRARSGYSALVAEAMLQQTQVSRVVERFTDFMGRFPTIDALAAADEQEVLAAWQGLGYYRRARHLHAAARAVAEHHDGRVPDDAKTLQSLPGVGRYTAGAIASIVHGEPAPIVDGNVQRVLARWDGDARAPDDRAAVAQTWRRAAELVAIADDPGAFNEALMELGALVCTPRAPRCLLCPVAEDCRAQRQGKQQSIPPPRRAAPVKPTHHHAVIIRRGERVLLERRPERGLWARMWQPPTVEVPRRLEVDALGDSLAARRLPVTGLEPLGGFEHRTTHRHVTFHVFAARSRVRRGDWRAAGELHDLPMSNAHRRLVREFV